LGNETRVGGYAYAEFEKSAYTVTSGTTVVRDPAK